MDEQTFRKFVTDSLPPEIEYVEVASVEASDDFGVLVNAVDSSGRELQLVPLFPARMHVDILAGDQGLALLCARNADSGLYLPGVVIKDTIPEGWDNSEQVLEARTLLRLRSNTGIVLEGEYNEYVLAAARKTDPVEVVISGVSGGTTLAALATALLATGAFVGTGLSPLLATPPAVPIQLTGTITGGSGRVKIGGGNE